MRLQNSAVVGKGSLRRCLGESCVTILVELYSCCWSSYAGKWFSETGALTRVLRFFHMEHDKTGRDAWTCQPATKSFFNICNGFLETASSVIRSCQIHTRHQSPTQASGATSTAVSEYSSCSLLTEDLPAVLHERRSQSSCCTFCGSFVLTRVHLGSRV